MSLYVVKCLCKGKMNQIKKNASGVQSVLIWFLYDLNILSLYRTIYILQIKKLEKLFSKYYNGRRWYNKETRNVSDEN